MVCNAFSKVMLPMALSAWVCTRAVAFAMTAVSAFVMFMGSSCVCVGVMSMSVWVLGLCRCMGAGRCIGEGGSTVGGCMGVW